MKKNQDVYYGDYLQLNKLLDSQHLLSSDYNNTAHDEMLFIITHQAYELWFKQILHELRTIQTVFEQKPIDDKQLGVATHRLERILAIQTLMIEQVNVLETMTPLDFLDFRDYLVPASGFQSVQFKEIEIRFGLKSRYRIAFDQQNFYRRLKTEHQEYLKNLELQPSLLEQIDQWLARLPFLNFGEFNFWQSYQQAVNNMLNRDEQIITNNPHLGADEKDQQLNSLADTRNQFKQLLEPKAYQLQFDTGFYRISQDAFLAALFISLYRDEPMLQQPYKLLTCLMDIDERFSAWRTRHAQMALRMLGRKVGTGGSSGHDYLAKAASGNKVFTDLFTLSTFLIPSSSRPELPDTIKQSLGFYLSGT
ncbi:tryptophan 2,3-dioxygenase [Endozoicomonas sp. SM1973]|uniref:Tryptophan 2,3-dioxygenase n=1 Tax=Spartinivicinus marinus TaxID=2994442 RepID=A0A853IBB6_9GAMM|nr:tryptophan 2,3-dioxygenase family protein [Spartinivicinus marinus]MCX4026455.1 tryptophan 2,3-dioxygenase family protein [Spartinivicinus marinus]NYZ66827.1 tryptophan 2,3-dioxygenase [Spartinivicinus marinus]